MTGAPGLEARARAALGALDRRAVLRLLGAAAVAGLVPACGAPPTRLAPPAGPPLRVLTPRTHAIFTAAAARIVGPDAGALVRDGRLHAGRLADAWLARAPAVAAAFRQALLFLELAVFPLAPKVSAFTTLDGTRQDAVLADFAASRLALKRQVFQGVRAVALLGTYLAPEARPLIHYPGPFGTDEVTVGDAMTPYRPETWSRRGARARG